MINIKTKAIFYAYSNNALDHLAPYVFLCHQKKMNCIVIYGEDFARHKVNPKSDIVKIFEDLNISTYDITRFEKKGFLQIIFSLIWFFAKKIDKYHFIPIFVKNKIKGLCNRIYENLDGELIGKNTASKLLKDTERVLVFTDHWNNKKKIQNGFLSHLKGKAKIISTGHAIWHFNYTPPVPAINFTEDIALVVNHWESDHRTYVAQKEVIGSLRFSKKWLDILDQYNDEKIPNKNDKTKVLILTNAEKHTSDWRRMFELLETLTLRKDIDLCVIPHIRGMSSMNPPKSLKNVWDNISTLDVAVKKSNIVIFWESSGIFEAVLRNKKVLYLSFLSVRNGKYLWQNNAPSNIIIKNEIELFDKLDNYDRNIIPDNSCFEKIIWPKGDPWFNASNFLDKLLNSNS